ncbi:MAG: hypothetical protein ACKVX9_08560 [Blastocatellia bacterium]
MMTRRAAITILGLAGLTLAGFVIVSNAIIGRRLSSPIANRSAPPPGDSAKPSAAPSPQALSGRTSPTEAQMRTEMASAQSLLDQINAEVDSSDWKSAQQHFMEFEARTGRLPAPQLNHPDISPMMQDFFVLYRVQLSRGIARQNLQEVHFAANQLFGIVSEQRARLGSRGVPIEFQRLHFLIREIETWNRAGDEEMAQIRARALVDAWREVRPVIVARRNGVSVAREFDRITEGLSNLQAANLPGATADLTRQFELMTGLFQGATRPAPPSPAPKLAEDE